MLISAYRRRPSHLRERKSQTSKVPWERNGHEAKGQLARERIGQGPVGRFAPGNELAWERKGSVPTRAVGLV